MNDLLLIVHALLVLALIGVVLMQRSEGGGLGIGGGGMGGMMSGRSQANFMTKLTSILAGLFMLSSLGLTILMNSGEGGGSLTDRLRDAGTPGITDGLTTPGAASGEEGAPAEGGTAEPGSPAPGVE